MFAWCEHHRTATYRLRHPSAEPPSPRTADGRIVLAVDVQCRGLKRSPGYPKGRSPEAADRSTWLVSVPRMLSVGSALAPMTVSGRLPYCALLRKLSSVAQRGPAWGWLSK
ncbi:hypothetical protein GCM10026982_05260 [Nocardiopsis aegyptia]